MGLNENCKSIAQLWLTFEHKLIDVEKLLVKHYHPLFGTYCLQQIRFKESPPICCKIECHTHL